MSHFVKIGAVHLTPIRLADWISGREYTEAERHKLVLEQTRIHLERFRGRGVDLVLTPEFVESKGQTPETAEELDDPGPYLRMYLDFAREAKCHVAGSAKVRDGDHVYNAIVFCGPGGDVLGCYRKTFLTERERGIMTSGPGAVVVETAVGRLGGAICFDLNFERLRKQYAELKPRIICFSSAYHGGLAQAMWAYDCRAYFVSSHMNVECGILDPFGRHVARSSGYDHFPMATVNLDYAILHLDANGAKLNDIFAKYADEVTVSIPPHIGSFLLASNSADRTALDIVAEFDLELLDDYFVRSVAANDANRA